MNTNRNTITIDYRYEINSILEMIKNDDEVYPQKRNVRECWNEMSVKVDVKRDLERVILTISIETKCP